MLNDKIMLSNLLNMKLKNFVFLLLLVLCGIFMFIFYMTQATVRDTKHLNKKHRYLGIAIDDVFIEDVIDPAKMQKDQLLDVSHFERILNSSSGQHIHKPRRSDYINKLLPQVPAESSIFTTNRMPTDKRHWPVVGNGHIATVIDSQSVYMNGLYNGYLSQSHRARIPSAVAVKLTPIGVFKSVKTYYSLDVGQGIFNETITSSYFEIEKLVYAHREIEELLVVDLRIQRWDIGTPLTVFFSVNHGPASGDITFTQSDGIIAETVKLNGVTKQPETNFTKPSPVHIIHTRVPHNITFTDSMAAWAGIYFMSISHSPSVAQKSYESGLELVKRNALHHVHVNAWAQIWAKGRLDVEGDLPIAQMNYAALYYIISSLPSHTQPDWPFVGLSPCGLANGGDSQDYWGHVMWDQDTWMFPTILLLHQDMGKTILSTRTRTLHAATQHANATGYKGVRYPWESAFTGVEVTPSGNCSRYEQHINGDITLAYQQYLYVSNDTEFLLHHGGIQLIKGIAEFWASRVQFNKRTRLYHINGVMPPDERHFPVNNSVYTNAIAVQSLLLASYALSLIGEKVPEEFTTIANKLYMPFDSRREYHPEYDGYKIGTPVKQADVVLLGFPVEMKMTSNVRRNDLLIYEKVIEVDGPAMTWQVFSIGWFEVLEKDRAEKLFDKWKHYVKGPFKVWTEEASGEGCVNFNTGMGGYLQSVVYGYLGMRIHRDNLQLNPVLPKNATRIRVTGVDYLGNSLDFLITRKSIKIVLTDVTSLSRKLDVSIPRHYEKHRLVLKEALIVERQLMYISPAL